VRITATAVALLRIDREHSQEGPEAQRAGTPEATKREEGVFIFERELESD